MKRLILFTAILVVIPLSTYAQESWIRVLGGAEDDQGYGFELTEDGGCLVVGWTESFGSGKRDLWLIRFDSTGDTLWTKTYGGPENDEGYCIQETTDSCYIITGMTESFGAGLKDLWLLKVDFNGDSLWTKTYGDEYEDYGQSVQVTNDGDFILTGSGSSELWLLKTDVDGNSLWSRKYTSCEYCDGYGNWGQQTSDGGYIVTGSTEYDLWLLKTDSIGDTMWTRKYGDDNFAADDWGTFVKQTPDSGYIVCGRNGSRKYVWLLKTDSLGNIEWDNTFYGGGLNHSETAYHLCLTSDGGYVLTGEMVNKYFLLRTDSIGEEIWIRQWTIFGYGYQVTEYQNGGFLVSGSAELWKGDVYPWHNDVLLIKTDSNGYFREELTPTRSITPASGDSIRYSVTPTVFFTYLANRRNSWLMPPFRYFCEIRNLDQDEVVYKDTVFIFEYDPEYDPEKDDYSSWENKEIEFTKWFADTTGEYSITFSFDTLYPGTWPDKTRPLTINFFVSSIEPGISEQPTTGETPCYEVLAPVGHQITLRYSDCPYGFHANIFNAAGRKVAALHSTQPSGTLKWGAGYGCYGPGVYFIRDVSGHPVTHKVVLVK